MEKALKNLVKQLRRKATQNWNKVGNDSTYYEGVCKGMYIGYVDAASRLEKIIKSAQAEEGKV